MYWLNTLKCKNNNNSSATKAQESVATTAVPAIQNCNCNTVYIST